MVEIVNLNRARKQRARAKQAAQAAANRVRYGRTGAEKAQNAQADERRRTLLDGTRLDEAPGRPDDDPSA